MIENLDDNRSNKPINMVIIRKYSRLKNVFFITGIISTLILLVMSIGLVKLTCDFSRLIKTVLAAHAILAIWINPSYAPWVKDDIVKTHVDSDLFGRY